LHGHFSPSSIVILRALQLGDLLCAVPAFRALRAAYPSARITLVGLPWAKDFVHRFKNYLNDFIEFPGYPGLPERLPLLHEFPAFLARVQERKFDLALQMHGSGSFVNPLTVLFGALRTAGFYVRQEYCPDARRFLPYPEREPEVRRNLQLLEFLGISPQGEHFEFPLTAGDRAEVRALPESARLERAKYVCIHPGSRMLTRRWQPERFAAVADFLVKAGFTAVITGSPDEVPLAAAVKSAMRYPAVNLAGRTSLGGIAAIIRDARLLVSNDTGVSHIAAAFDTPRVVIVTGSDPNRWQPADTGKIKVICEQVACRPCNFASCPIGSPCAVKVRPETVISSITELLNEDYAYAP
jgi:ADP-heptose:LPS heptosyltransferase